MFPDNKRFGEFITELRKQKNLTQKQLAQKLNVSDKAVSKWERGLSFPDISLLLPLCDVLEVSATELLEGEKLEQSKSFSKTQVDNIIKKLVEVSDLKNIFNQKEPFDKTVKVAVATNILSILTVFVPFAFCLFVFEHMSFVLSFIPIIMVGPIASLLADIGILINVVFLLLALWLCLKKSVIYLFSTVSFIVAIVFLIRYNLMLGRLATVEGFWAIVITELSCYLIALLFAVAVLVFGCVKQRRNMKNPSRSLKGWFNG